MMMRNGLLALAVCAGMAEAADCPAAESLEVAGIRIGATLAEVQQVYPGVSLDGEMLSEPDMDEVSRRYPGIFTLWRVGMDSEGRVDAISAGLAEPIATFETAAQEVLKNVTAHFGWPRDGWEKQPLMAAGEMKALGYSEDAARFVLDCGAYQIEVVQDFGSGRQSLGAYVIVEVKK